MDLTPPPPTAASDPYCGPLVAPADLWAAWNTDPLLLATLGLPLMLVAWQMVRSRNSGVWPSKALGIAGVGLIVAFVSPLCAATVALFAARSMHHLILISVVAPAIAVALPIRRASGEAGLAATTVVLVLWHMPSVYDAAWQDDTIYWSLQGSLIGAGWLFWSAVLRPRSRAETVFLDALLVGGLAAIMGLIGAVLTFAPTGLYAVHLTGADAFGLSLLQDQQLAGLIMWVPGFAPLAVLAFGILARGWSRGFAS